MTDVIVEDAASDDAGEIWTVQRAAYVSEAQLYGDPFIAPLVESRAQVRAAITGPGAVLVARSAGRVIGAVRGLRNGRTCQIGRLVVAPDRQHGGVGGALLAAIEQRFAAEVDGFTLFTGHLSEGNLRLYRGHGYVETHREPLTGSIAFVQLRKSAPERELGRVRTAG